MNEPTAPRKEHLYEQIANNIERDIISGLYADSKLPSEQELTVKYSSSRTVIREALKILSERRLINSVVGSGAYITRPEAEDLSVVIRRISNTHDFSVIDIIDMRIILESNAAALAALNATEDEFDEMNNILKEMADVRVRLQCDMADIEELIELDHNFHLMLCKASHNELLYFIANAISSIVRDFLGLIMSKGSERPETRKQFSHSKILNAVRSRNQIAAQNAVYDHLYSTKRLYENFILDKSSENNIDFI